MTHYFQGGPELGLAQDMFQSLALVLDGGTVFQERVWTRLRAIPPGETLSYGVLAKELGTSPRAIGQACRTNPVAIVVPCHRVVGAQGLGGYSGHLSGAVWQRKRQLLRHEGVECNGD